ncbi:MAG: ribosome maturation factor RimP [Cyanobacteriota bacterium]|jgi:ribosome maturation factor RimP
MTHPLIPPILELATPIAQRLGLEVVSAVFQTNKTPPVLRLDIRNPQEDTSLDHCEALSRELDEQLEATALIPHAYVLEVSSPGLSPILTTERDFLSFKGFKVAVDLTEEYQKRRRWEGALQGRDETHLHLQVKGRAIALPRELVATVQLAD